MLDGRASSRVWSRTERAGGAPRVSKGPRLRSEMEGLQAALRSAHVASARPTEVSLRFHRFITVQLGSFPEVAACTLVLLVLKGKCCDRTGSAAEVINKGAKQSGPPQMNRRRVALGPVFKPSASRWSSVTRRPRHPSGLTLRAVQDTTLTDGARARNEWTDDSEQLWSKAFAKEAKDARVRAHTP